MTPQDFVAKWSDSRLRERQGEWYARENGAQKTGGRWLKTYASALENPFSTDNEQNAEQR